MDIQRQSDEPTDNERSLQQLAWTLQASVGQFKLIWARCNYSDLRTRLIERLSEICPLKIQVLQLKESERTLYTAIREELQPDAQALMIVGWESLHDLPQMLTSANQVREEFRKNLSIPVVVWISEEIHHTIMEIAPDLESWGTSRSFAITPTDLAQFIKQSADEYFERKLSINDYYILELELEAAQRDILADSPEIEANLASLLGLVKQVNNKIDEALEYYQKARLLWQQLNSSEKQVKILGEITYCYYLKALKIKDKAHADWQVTWEYTQEYITYLQEANSQDLAANSISRFGNILRDLKEWEQLNTIASFALQVHLANIQLVKVAKDYGFLAQVALAQKNWIEAKQLAQKAKDILPATSVVETKTSLTEEPAVPDDLSLYYFILAQAEYELGEPQQAIANLEVARDVSNPVKDLQLHLDILSYLQILYFEKKEYLKAYETKQQQRSVEQQFGLRAFIGAGRLQSTKQALVATSKTGIKESIAPEITASGRLLDIERLVERLGRHDHKLIVIHGQSGVGKSSLVNAGLVPALKNKSVGIQDYLPVAMRVYTNWVEELGRSLQLALYERRGAVNEQALGFEVSTLIAQLHENEQHNLRTVLIFDQFEEFFFVYPQTKQRQQFFEFLGECLNILSVKVILSLRVDYLHYLLECNEISNMAIIGKDILSSNVLYKLGNFSPIDARSIIRRLTETTAFQLETALIDQLVIDLAENLGEVRPIELQIVGMQLQTENITTLEKYLQIGTKDNLVKRFLEEVITDCGTENEQIARLVLYSLTDETGTRPLKTRTQLTEQLALELEKFDLVIGIFIKSGLVILLPESPENRYQLVHDYLVALIREQQGEKLIVELEKERKQRKSHEERLARIVNVNDILTTSQEQAKRETLEQEIKVGWVILSTFIKGITIAGCVAIMRIYGLLQPLELKAYDQMLRSRPPEAPEQRILLVKITEEDLQREQGNLSDRTINQLLEKLNSYQPRIIGLYLFRPEQKNLAANLQNRNNIITTCLFSSIGRAEIPPPSNFPIDNVGFSDIVTDKESDQILRRGLLFANSTDKKCTTGFSFGSLIAINYLAKQGIKFNFTNEGNFQVGKIVFPRLEANSGSYKGLDAAGYQILLNYRHPNSFVNQVSLSDVLNDRVSSNLIKDHLVIIGSTAASLSPGSFYTPYSALPDQPARMSALMIHAETASQLISTVLDGRPLVTYWTEPMEGLWLVIWSLIGASISAVFWKRPSWKWLFFTMFLSTTSIVVICYLAFLQSLWLPLIPAILVLLCARIPMPLIPSYPLDKLRFQRTLELILEAYHGNPSDARLAVEYLIKASRWKNIAIEVLVSNTIDILESCQTPESIATIANRLNWIPSQLSDDFKYILNKFIYVSQLVKVALDTKDKTPVYKQHELFDESINVLHSIVANLNSSVLNRFYQVTSFEKVAKVWLTVLNIKNQS
jgi:CHASE2 domain-containing sensor protein/tetratricopeptide (TPR) repeat protein